METLKKFDKTYRDVQKALQNKDLFRDGGLAGPVSLAEALRMDMSCLAEASGKIGWPPTAWWWYVEDFYRPVGRSDLRNLLPREEELDPWKDPVFRMPLVGNPDGRRTLTEFWESLGYETLRKERRSGRLAEKKAFHAGFDIPSAPSDEWLGLPKEFLKDKANAADICKDPEILQKLKGILADLKETPETAPTDEAAPKDVFSERYLQMHPLTKMLLEEKSSGGYSEQCLSIGPDDEVAAEILKLQETLLEQMVMNRSLARNLCKAALKTCKFERKQAARRERIEREILKCQKVIEAHEKTKKEDTPKSEAPAASQEVPMTGIAAPVTSPTPQMVTPSPTAQVLVAVQPVAETFGLPKKEDHLPTQPVTDVCDVCGMCEEGEALLQCNHCGIHVHASCYETASPPEEGVWFCLPCRIYHERQRDLQIKGTGLKSGGALSVDCKACPNRGGVHQRTADMKKWIHTVCSMALSDPVLKATTVIRRCTVCEKLKGRVFPCHRKGCRSTLHAFCARNEGKLKMEAETHAEGKSLRITCMLCPACAAGGDKVGGAASVEEVPVLNTDRKPSSQVKSGRGLSTTRSQNESSILSDEDGGSGRIASRTRAKRLKPDPDRPKTGRRGRPRNVHRRKRSRKDASPEGGMTSTEDRETRRMTRSMR